MATFLKFLNSVRVPKNTIIAVAAINAANMLNLPDMWVTSGNDSVHMVGSKHYTNEALDFRTKHLDKEQKTKFISALKLRLGPAYQLILEDEGGGNEHLHVEHDPKV